MTSLKRNYDNLRDLAFVFKGGILSGMDELLIEGKTYISSKQAALLSGYAKDYIGQLCREGRISAKLVGRSWYVLRESLEKHRFSVSEPEDGKKKSNRPAPQNPSPEANSSDGETRYTSENPQELVLSEAQTTEAAREPLEEVQEAWREWFEKKVEDEPAKTEDASEERDQPESSVPIKILDSRDEFKEKRDVERRARSNETAESLPAGASLARVGVSSRRATSALVIVLFSGLFSGLCVYILQTESFFRASTSFFSSSNVVSSVIEAVSGRRAF